MKFHAFRLHLKPKIHIMLNLHCPKPLSKKKRVCRLTGEAWGVEEPVMQMRWPMEEVELGEWGIFLSREVQNPSKVHGK
jgi:hypothetical protein